MSAPARLPGCCSFCDLAAGMLGVLQNHTPCQCACGGAASDSNAGHCLSAVCTCWLRLCCLPAGWRTARRERSHTRAWQVGVWVGWMHQPPLRCSALAVPCWLLRMPTASACWPHMHPLFSLCLAAADEIKLSDCPLTMQSPRGAPAAQWPATRRLAKERATRQMPPTPALGSTGVRACPAACLAGDG